MRPERPQLLDLGLDLGTSKVAAVLVARGSGQVCHSLGLPHQARAEGLPAGWDEQEPEPLLACCRELIARLPAEARLHLGAIGVTGQMHGVLVLDQAQRPLTRLVTWQDQRCQQGDFLSALERRTGNRHLRTGYGLATLAWLGANGGLPADAATAATIHDYLVARLCGLRRPLTDPTDAASWGLFDVSAMDWDAAGVAAAGVPAGLLPPVRPCGTVAGRVTPAAAAEFGVPAGTPVTVAIGDNQASMISVLQDRDPATALVLTLGTGGQLSAVMPRGFSPPPLPDLASFEYRPYPGQRYAAVAAALCGGSAFAWLVEGLQQWLRELGLPAVEPERLYATLSELGLEASGAGLSVSPRFLGERHAPADRGSIGGIDRENFTLGDLARALARGIVTNLRDMLPAPCLDGRTCIVGSGNAVRRLPLLRACVEEVMGLPLLLAPEGEEAASGAARLARLATDPVLSRDS